MSAEKAATALVPAGLTRDEILTILEARARAAQHELARAEDAGADVLDYLATNGAVATRRAVAASPAAPPAANRRLADDADEEVRAQLARKIARLMPDLPPDEQDHLRRLTLETLDRLARDQETRVRAVLAEGIKSLACVPHEIVERLAGDVEIVVAGPILEYSPLLSDADLLEILASAKAEEALAAVARRRPLSPALSDAIVGSLDIPAVAALLANPRAEIREQTLDRIIQQAEGVSSLQMPLTLRTDLSPRAIKRIATFVGAELIERLAERHGLDEDTQAILRRELRERLGREKEKAPDVVHAAKRSGTLDQGFVESAAETGQRDIVAQALAELASVPVEKVRKILASRNAKPLTALVWRAKLTMRASFKIQSFIMRLPSGELLPARGGTHFPLSEDEMRWHLNYFDIAG
jgi:uncharacterized protein (DUF2336 family)